MKIIRSPAAMTVWRAKLMREGVKIGFVPTMGALHDGHRALIRDARLRCDMLVVSIFVNPTQFGPHEDFTRYPRQLSRDLEILQNEQVDLVFAPSQDEMYRPGHSTYVTPPNVAEGLEGTCRPGHFRGVTTIVSILLHAIPADIAYFGQKDYQQYLTIRQMAHDLRVPTQIRMCPTVRESDGLAMSSRNRYLSADERTRALTLSRSLELAQQLIHAGTRHVAEITARMREVLLDAGVHDIDYVTIADADTLEELREVDRKSVALVAARVGTTRLIDNKLLALR